MSQYRGLHASDKDFDLFWNGEGNFRGTAIIVQLIRESLKGGNLQIILLTDDGTELINNGMWGMVRYGDL